MYNALIIGAGSIGAWKDEKFDSPLNPEKVLTHAHAYFKNPDTKLFGIIDRDIVRASSAGVKWGAEYATNSEDITTVLDAFNGAIDIISVCTDTSTHYEIIKKICRAVKRPKIIICEKPCGSNYIECAGIVKECKDAGIKLIVPYVRRFVPELQAVKTFVDNSEVVYAANIYYNRGLYRDGCHAIDFASYLFGRTRLVDVLHAAPIADYSADDLTRGIVLVMDRCKQVVMHPVDGRVGSIFEMDIVTSSGRLRLVENYATVERYHIEDEPIYGSYKRISPVKHDYPTQLHKGLEFIIQNAVDVINGASPICTGEDALNVHKIIEWINVR